MTERIISILREKQDRLSRRYEELENLQGELQHAYSVIQGDMQRVDEINEFYRLAIYNLEMAAQLEKGVV